MEDNPQWYIVINPAAGHGQVGQQWPKIQARLDALAWSYAAHKTRQVGHATQLVREGIEKGHRYILAIGGDGTNNEAINGIFQQKEVPSSAITYALLPIGTGNDWIKSHGIPWRLEAWLTMMKAGKTAWQDIGQVSYYWEGQEHRRYFVNVAGMGYDAYVAKMAEAEKGRVSSKLFYFYMVFKCLADYTLQKAKVIFDGEEIEDTFYTIHAGICRYSGGGMRFVPHALVDDGRLALTLIRNISKWGIVVNMYRLYTGSIGNLPQVDTYYAKKIRVEAIGEESTLVEVDGEFLGETPVEFTVQEKALRFICV